MKKLALILVFLLTGGVIYSQTAKVLTLKAGDAAKAKALWDRLQSAQKDWDDFNSEIKNNYLYADCAVVTGGQTTYLLYNGAIPPSPQCPLSGWENGFVFSEDFKSIVPKTYSTPALTWPPYNNCGGYVFNGQYYWNGSTNCLTLIGTGTTTDSPTITFK